MAGDTRATAAIDLFVHRAAAGIAAAATTLPLVDAVVFTGGIGEHAASVRAAICERLVSFGVPVPPGEPLDDDEPDAVLAADADGVAVLRVHAREDLIMARDALTVVAPPGSLLADVPVVPARRAGRH